jgi:hypothetical protein
MREKKSPALPEGDAGAHLRKGVPQETFSPFHQSPPARHPTVLEHLAALYVGPLLAPD